MVTLSIGYRLRFFRRRRDVCFRRLGRDLEIFVRFLRYTLFAILGVYLDLLKLFYFFSLNLKRTINRFAPFILSQGQCLQTECQLFLYPEE